MPETPTPLVLTLLAGVGTAVFSGLQAQGEPILILIIPITVLVAFVYGMDAAIMTGVGSGIIAGILLQQVEGWEILVYSLGAALVGYVAATQVKKRDTIQYLFFIGIGTIVLELLLNIYLGKSIIARSEDYLGSSAVSGLRLMINLVLGGILASVWLPEPKKENENEKKGH